MTKIKFKLTSINLEKFKNNKMLINSGTFLNRFSLFLFSSFIIWIWGHLKSGSNSITWSIWIELKTKQDNTEMSKCHNCNCLLWARAHLPEHMHRENAEIWQEAEEASLRLQYPERDLGEDSLRLWHKTEETHLKKKKKTRATWKSHVANFPLLPDCTHTSSCLWLLPPLICPSWRTLLLKRQNEPPLSY